MLKYILKLHLSVPKLQIIQTNILPYFLVNINFICISTNKKPTWHNNNQLRKKNFTPATYKTIYCVKVLLEIPCLVEKKIKKYSNNKAMAMKSGGSLALETYWGLIPESPS